MSAPYNSEPCNCFFLHEAATNPDSPIVFDAQLNEFHIQTRNGYSMIYYCPICGGKAPASVRDDLFAIIAPEEEARLTEIARECLSEQDMRRTLGEPDRTRISYSYKNFSESAYIVGLVENGAWKGMHFTRKQIKLISPESVG